MTGDPYEVLGVDRHADETVVRRRYLELVRQHPPDRDPERFSAIRAAYDQTRNPLTRLETLLFDIGNKDSLQTIVDEMRSKLGRNRIPVSTLLSLTEIK